MIPILSNMERHKKQYISPSCQKVITVNTYFHEESFAKQMDEEIDRNIFMETSDNTHTIQKYNVVYISLLAFNRRKIKI